MRWNISLRSGKTMLPVVLLSSAVSLMTTINCSAQNTTNFPTIGHVDRFDSAVDDLIDSNAVIQVLCGGFEWSEGPVWVPEQTNKFGGFLLFSDIPHNAVMKWQEGVGA